MNTLIVSPLLIPLATLVATLLARRSPRAVTALSLAGALALAAAGLVLVAVALLLYLLAALPLAALQRFSAAALLGGWALHGVLLAVHAFLPVARLYEKMIEARHPLAAREDFVARHTSVPPSLPRWSVRMPVTPATPRPTSASCARTRRPTTRSAPMT